MTEFIVTDDHIKLLSRMYVSWDDCEYGAPQINPKRPYGNSQVEEDIAQILGWEPDSHDEDGFAELSEAQRERAARLHRETQTALQIRLIHAGSDTPFGGRYVLADRWDSTSWVAADL